MRVACSLPPRQWYFTEFFIPIKPGFIPAEPDVIVLSPLSTDQRLSFPGYVRELNGSAGIPMDCGDGGGRGRGEGGGRGRRRGNMHMLAAPS